MAGGRRHPASSRQPNGGREELDAYASGFQMRADSPVGREAGGGGAAAGVCQEPRSVSASAVLSCPSPSSVSMSPQPARTSSGLPPAWRTRSNATTAAS